MLYNYIFVFVREADDKIKAGFDLVYNHFPYMFIVFTHIGTKFPLSYDFSAVPRQPPAEFTHKYIGC